MPETIGFIGLGVMGKPMAKNLMKGGHALVVYNRSRASVDELKAAGAAAAASPADVARQSNVVITMLPDTPDVELVLAGEHGVLSTLKPKSVVVDMSSVSPIATRRLASTALAKGSAMLDAPVSGGEIGAINAQLSIMVGGDEAAFERAKPVLLAIGPKVTRIGASGLAVQMKIAVNLLLMVEVIAFGEAVALAEKGGVAREVAVDAILKSVAASPVLGYRGPFILEGKMPAVPLADVTLQQKDMLLALELGRKLGSPVPLAAAANEMMNACRGLGIDHRDFVTAHEVYRRLGGQT
jgi:3-hydroxyisobutyrate dehydrogenase-like beta-hydroxyacid dehydrogenase